MTGFSKIENFFRIHRLREEREFFDYHLKYGSGYRFLRMSLWYWADQVDVSFDASVPAIVSYAKKNGLWEARQQAIAVRKSSHRKFRRKDRSWGIEMYKELARR